MKMNNKELTNKAIHTASDIYFSENKLKEIAYLQNCEWKCKSYSKQEEFEKEIKNNKRLYNKLRKYKDELMYRLINKNISKEEYNLTIDKIDSLENGKYKEKYC
ncbi:hypothetical protein [Clostridium botulinum]|uniref:hypothetical protein n=1 Tax=Clostridium botulinum TaxID=1491 RepID=UPI001C9B0BC6|nr:hypothetical protein [Clostridium botulinum]MBY6838794.1 hypothetical protein [Clostridium botulinum]